MSIISKYHNRKTSCLSRHVHDSKFEAEYCNRLLAMKQAGEITHFRIQVSFDFYVNNSFVGVHIVDFLVAPAGWAPILGAQGMQVHEVKGFETDVWKIKRNLFKALYPEIEYIIIKKGGDHVRRKSPLWSSKRSKSARGYAR